MIKIIRKDNLNDLDKPEWIIHMDDDDFVKYISHELMSHMQRVGIPDILAKRTILQVFASDTVPNKTPGFEEIKKFHPLLMSCIMSKWQHVHERFKVTKEEKKNES